MGESLNDGTTIAVPFGQTMETITPSPLIKLRMPDAPPEATPENPPEGFAQVMARQENFSLPKENPVGLEQEVAGPKAPLAPEEKAKPESPDPANDPEVNAFLTTPISNTILPSPPKQPDEPPVALNDPTFLLKIEARPPNPALALTEKIGSGSRTMPLPEDFLIANETVPAIAPAFVQPEGTLKENPAVSKAFEALILSPAPEPLTLIQNVSPETTEIVTRSSQTTTENSPSFSPQGPAIPETTLIVDGLDPSPSLILREFALKGQNGETAALETNPDSQVPPSEALSRTGKFATAPILERAPIVEMDPVESNSQPPKISAMVASPTTLKATPSERGSYSSAMAEGLPDLEKTSPTTLKATPSDRGISLSARAEGLPDPEKTSPTLLNPDPEPTSFDRRPLEKVEPGIALLDPEEILAGSGKSETKNLTRFQEDTPLGAIAKFPDQPRGEGVPVDRLVEGPVKGSPEWIKEALSVYQQFSKGLLRTLQQGGERIQMTLDPPQLGTILMEINRDRNLVTAHLWTDNPQTKDLLDFSRGQLQKTLELDGFKLDRFEVLVQPDLRSFQEERWFGGRQPTWPDSRPEGNRASPEGLISASPETASLRFSQGNRYVDTWV